MKIIKKLVFSLLLSVMTTISYGQENVNNFIIDNSELVWQKVFETSMTFEELKEKIKDSGLFEKVEISDNKLSGEIKPFSADFNGAGFSEMSAPIYIARSTLSGFIIIEYKENKYRVTLKKILLTQKYTDPLTNQGETTQLEFFGLKNNMYEMTNYFKKSPSYILDYTLTKKFDFKDSTIKKEW
jgi:hypothetical protein